VPATNPLTTFASVDLPEPLSPTMASVPPARASMLASLNA
jgi:hypothetical protein